MMKVHFAVLALSMAPALAAAAAADNLDWLYSRPDAVQPSVPAPGGGPAAIVPGPDLVLTGRPPEIRPCNSCHTPSGAGQPESANLRGLPAAYLQKAMLDFRSGAHKGTRATSMLAIARAMSDDDIKQTSDYYAAMKPIVWNQVVEAATVPKTYVSDTGNRKAWPEGGTELLGSRIIEYAPDQTRVRAAGAVSPFTAYVPEGSIAKGLVLGTTGGAGKTNACVLCHGETLTGLGDIPGIAGRSPLYIARQLALYQSGERGGGTAALMKAVTAKLNIDDIIAVSAWVGSRNPS